MRLETKGTLNMDEQEFEALKKSEPTMAPQERRDWQAKMFLNGGERLLYKMVSRSFLKHTFIHKRWIRLLERRHNELADFLSTPVGELFDKND